MPIAAFPEIETAIRQQGFGGTLNRGIVRQQYSSGNIRQIKTESAPWRRRTISLWLSKDRYRAFIDWLENELGVGEFMFTPLGSDRMAVGRITENPTEGIIDRAADEWSIGLVVEFRELPLPSMISDTLNIYYGFADQFKGPSIVEDLGAI